MAIKPAKNAPATTAAVTVTDTTDTPATAEGVVLAPPPGTPAPADGVIHPEPQPGGNPPATTATATGKRGPGRPTGTGLPPGPALIFSPGMDDALAREVLSGKYPNLTALVAGLKVNPAFSPQAVAVTEGAIRRRLALQRKSMVAAAAKAREEGNGEHATIWDKRAHQLSFNRARGPRGSRNIDLDALAGAFEETE